jgi:replicative DNA helicase
LNVTGTVPPNAFTAEVGLINACLHFGREVAGELIGDANADDFYSGAHRAIWQSIGRLVNGGSEVDTITILDDMKAANTLSMLRGGSSWFATVMADLPIPTRTALEDYKRSVRDAAQLRKLLLAAQRIVAGCHDGHADVGAFLAKSAAVVADIADNRKTDTLKPMVEHCKAFATDVIDRANSGGAAGLPTGLSALDRAFDGGMLGGELIVVAARPGMGKSALGFGLAAYAAVDHEPKLGVAAFSLEMPGKQVAGRLGCARGHVELGHLRSGNMSPDGWRRLNMALSEVSSSPAFWLDDQSFISLDEIRSRVRRVQRSSVAKDTELGLVVVDYVQLMSGDEESREREVAQISRGLKAIAKDFDVPVVALAQLNRGVESRSDKRPMLSDLRESGAIEQDADKVVFIYRDNYYNAASTKGERGTRNGVAELNVAKNRNGSTGVVELWWEAATTTFRDMTYEECQQYGTQDGTA